MSERQTLPNPLPLLWLLSDARNDDRLEEALLALPPNSGFVFRHYHLAHPQRRDRFAALAAVATQRRHLVLLAHGDWAQADAWGADGLYASPGEALGKQVAGKILLATAHDASEIARAEESGADGVFLSPVYPTSSHPDAPTLGPAGFLALAQAASVPVIALGGMTAARAAALGWPRWGAIDGLVPDTAHSAHHQPPQRA